MMNRKTTLYARTGASAIVAALALSSTPLIAQEAPAATQPVPTVTPPPPTTSDSTPAVTDAPPTTDSSSVDTTTAPAPKQPASRTRTTIAAAPVRTIHHATATRTTHVTVAPAAAPVPAKAATPAAPPPVSQPAAAPPVTNSAPSRARAAPPASHYDDTAGDLGIAALALVILGGGAWALSRRRRDDGSVEAYEVEPELERETVEPPTIAQEQTAIVAPSAFAWGNQPTSVAQASDDGSDRRAGETWVERAYRGPSPANPSASLRNRLKRAAFFDKREREVAAGTAEPVDTGAGLPESMAEERERELA